MAELCISVDDFILFFRSNFINRPSVLFLGGDVALVHKYLVYIYVSWEPADTRYIRADTFAGRSVLFGGADVALVHKYLHIRILGPG